MQLNYSWWILLQILLSIGLWLGPLLTLTSVFRKRKIKQVNTKSGFEPDYAIIVTAYQQVTLIPQVVQSILNINYENYIIYVVADNCDMDVLHISHDKVKILRPENILASNIRSHFYAIDRFERDHDIITIIDSDNLLDVEYLRELNVFFENGYKAVQGVRRAKNLNTVYACLDEAGDIFYRYMDRKLPFEAGSSASLAGSGMAFTTNIYKECLEHHTMGGAGFDKVLQYELINKKEQIAFAEKAVVYDEKTAKTDQLVKQRARWINTWFRFWILGLRMMTKSVINFNWNGIVFSQILLRPPLFLMIVLVGVVCFINIFTTPGMLIYWGVLMFSLLLCFFKSLRYFKADKRVYRSIRYIPKFIFFQLIAFTKAKKANKISVATQHDESAKADFDTNLNK